MMEQESLQSIDDIINEAANTLADDKPLGPFDEIQEEIDEIQYIDADFSEIDQLQSLLLYCEDIVNGIPNACEHSLYHNLYVDLKKKVDDFEAFYKKYEKNSYKLLTSKRCMEYVRWLNDRIIKLEQDIGT